MTTFGNIVIYNLIQFVNDQIKEIQQLQISRNKHVLIEDDLFANVNVFERSYVYQSVLADEWKLIDVQATQSIYKDAVECENKETKRIAKLYDATDNLNDLNGELTKEENAEDLEALEEAIAEEEYKKEQKKQVEELLAKFYKKEHPELTLPEFIEKQVLNEFKPTELMHDFVLEQKTEYDEFADSHLSFISDFFPVNNVDVSSLLISVRRAINTGVIDSSINIYKAWLNYLKDNNLDYTIYDWRRFTDQGEYIAIIDESAVINENVVVDVNVEANTGSKIKEELDDFLSKEDKIITYDEVKDKKAYEKAFQEKVDKILASGSYKSNFVLSTPVSVSTPTQNNDDEKTKNTEKKKKELYVNK